MIGLNHLILLPFLICYEEFIDHATRLCSSTLSDMPMSPNSIVSITNGPSNRSFVVDARLGKIYWTHLSKRNLYVGNISVQNPNIISNIKQLRTSGDVEFMVLSQLFSRDKSFQF